MESKGPNLDIENSFFHKCVIIVIAVIVIIIIIITIIIITIASLLLSLLLSLCYARSKYIHRFNARLNVRKSYGIAVQFLAIAILDHSLY